MPVKSPSFACVTCAFAVLAVCSTSWALPPLDIPESALKGTLSSSHVAQIQARIKHWVDQIATATRDEQAIPKARTGLINDYLSYESAGYRLTFAREAAKLLLPFLKDRLADSDALKPLKEVNAALAVVRMPQVSLQPVVTVMVAHGNPAVRYLGWRAYIGLRIRVMGQGAEVRDRIFASLKAAADTEESPPVMGQIFKMLQLPRVRPEAVAETTYRSAQRRSFRTLQEIWPKQCRWLIAADDPAVAEASLGGVEAVASFAGVMATDRSGRQTTLQMLVDVAYAAAHAYARAGAEGALAVANEGLLRECEKVLNAVAGKQNTYLERALSDSKILDRGAAVIYGTDPSTGKAYGVLQWIEELKDLGVVKPAIKAPAPTTTSAPASAPASRKASP